MTVRNLMEVEKQLLMIENSDKKFDLNFNDLLKLKKYEKQVGEITDLFFKSQVEYANKIIKYENYEKLLADYHDKLGDSEFDFDLSEINDFINKLNK